MTFAGIAKHIAHHIKGVKERLKHILNIADVSVLVEEKNNFGSSSPSSSFEKCFSMELTVGTSSDTPLH